ncbi:MAG: helix-turn-helix domain-containing protein [Proteobacteria bacterium]|nr:helix-turn-helix domain-containing protein [Pseudomonadota bacterium]
MKSTTFAERFQKIREKEGLSQAEFCELTGISLGTLKGVEHRGRDPRGSTLEKVAIARPRYAKFLLLGY